MNWSRNISLLLIMIPSLVFSQIRTITDASNLNLVNQDMFGVGFNLNFEQPIVDKSWNETVGPVGPGVTSTIVGDYGLEVSGGTSGHFKFTFYSRDWNTGEMDVDYPVDMQLKVPQDNTFNRGDWVKIETSYVPKSTAKLETQFPQVGRIGLEFDLKLRFHLSPMLCFVSCTNAGFDTGELQKVLTIFEVSHTGVTYACPNLSLQCTKPLLPANIPDVGIGLTGEIRLPNVTTTSTIEDKCLKAMGQDQYGEIFLDIFKFIGAMNIPGVSPAINNLTGGECFFSDKVCYSYVLFKAGFGVQLTNHQEINFCPEVFTTIKFPSPVLVGEVTPGGVEVQAPKMLSKITILAGNTIKLKYPCNYEFLEMETEYGLTGEFDNHTYDYITYDFQMEALSANLELKGFGLGEDSDDPTSEVDNMVYQIGPLFQAAIPLGSFPGIDWFDSQWNSGDTMKVVGTPFTIKPKEFLASITNSSDVRCAGENNGAATVQVVNGNAPYTYDWSNGFSDVTSATGSTVSNLAGGNVTVTVTDNQGCQSTASDIIIAPNQPLIAVDIDVIDVTCNGDADGEVSTLIVGGIPPYTYQWTPNVSSSNSAVNLSAGVYDILVTDKNDCPAAVFAEVIDPDAVGGLITTSDVSCKGESNGQASIAINGGTPSYFTQWSGGVVDGVYSVKDLSPGNHTIMITDANNCVNSLGFVISEPSSPLSINGDIVGEKCFGEKNGQITANVTGGTAPYTYQWSNSNNQLIPVFTGTITQLSAGIYTLTVTDINGCVEIKQFVVTGPSSELIVDASVTNVKCNGGNSGDISLVVSGGLPNYSYSWNPNVSTTNSASNLSAGSYIVSVADQAGCVLTNTVLVSEPGPIEVVSETDSVNCFGGNDGKAFLQVSGGTIPYSYFWPDGTSISQNASLVAGNYSVMVTDLNNCSVTEQVNVFEPTAALAISGNITKVSCFENQDGAVQTSVTGGTPGYIYQWSDSLFSPLFAGNSQVQNIPAGTYIFSVIDKRGCADTANFVVPGPKESLSNLIDILDVKCNGDATGNIQLVTSGGMPAYSYSWSANVSTSDVAANISAGNYQVTITDAHNCNQVLDIEVKEPSAITVQTIQENVKCFGEDDGAIEIVVNDGVFPYTYSWSNGQVSATNSGLVAGDYDVTITDANNCTKNITYSISEPADLNIVLTVQDVKCFGGNDGAIQGVFSGGEAPYHIAWFDSLMHPIQIDGSQVLQLMTGRYHVTVTDANGCTLTQSAFISQPENPITINETLVHVLCKDDATGVVDISVTGGTPIYYYQWSNGETVEDANVLSSGIHTVIVTDNNGCLLKDTFVINEPAMALSIVTEKIDVQCKGAPDGLAIVEAYGGVHPYTYSWSNGHTSDTAFGLSVGSYVITVTDVNSCTQKLTVDIEEPIDGLTQNLTIDSVTCYKFSDGKVVTHISGGYLPYTVNFGDSIYSLYNLPTEIAFDGLKEGEYYVNVVDSMGCEITQKAIVYQPDSLYATFDVKDALCFKDANGSVNALAVGGTPSYQYLWNTGGITPLINGLLKGDYIMELTDRNNCYYTDTVFVDHPDSIKLTKNVIPVSCVDQKDGEISIHVQGGVPDYIYNWVHGETSATIENLDSGFYQINVFDANLCEQKETVYVPKINTTCVIPSNAFTPDNDGYNDVWQIDNMELYPQVIVSVYNQWGKLVFSSQGYSVPWDGTYKGKLLPAATYYYVFDFKEELDPLKGTVNIVK